MDLVGNEAIVDASQKKKKKVNVVKIANLCLKITYIFTNSIITDEQNEMIIAMVLLTFDETTLLTP